jgi:hypothetical protein
VGESVASLARGCRPWILELHRMALGNRSAGPPGARCEFGLR